ncbi:MAG: c-type cytochrome, partial [candidate division NC10 bacterium]|nr:c-type cytochrome [candidate division NC10 bacterium]
MALIEPKGGVTVDKEPFPGTQMPKGGGYVLNPPTPQGRWEVSVYQFSPATVVVRQGERVTLEMVGINGAKHSVHMVSAEKRKVATIRRRPRRPAGAILAALSLITMVPIVSGEGNLPPGDPGQGEALYRQYCAVCHGATGEGDGPNAPFLEDDRPRDLTDARYMARLSDRDLTEVIRGGG